MVSRLFMLVFDSLWSFVFFFFQAEDGIRDWSVTGVQTCALPISRTFLTRDRGLPSDSLWLRHPLRERPQPCRRALRLPTSPYYEESHLPRLSEAVAFLWRPL